MIHCTKDDAEGINTSVCGKTSVALISRKLFSEWHLWSKEARCEACLTRVPDVARPAHPGGQLAKALTTEILILLDGDLTVSKARRIEKFVNQAAALLQTLEGKRPGQSKEDAAIEKILIAAELKATEAELAAGPPGLGKKS